MNNQFLARGKIKQNTVDLSRHNTCAFTKTTGFFPKSFLDDNNYWVYGYLLPNDMILSNAYDYDAEWKFEVDPVTIGQCTSLTDRNGELIFRSDIVKDEYERIMRVDFSMHFQQLRLYAVSNCESIHGMSSNYGVEAFSWIYPEMSLTVIGNIHDNSVDSVSTT